MVKSKKEWQFLQGGDRMCFARKASRACLRLFEARTRLFIVKHVSQCLTDHNKNAFGNIIQQTGNLVKRNILRFSSDYDDEDWGLIYYKYCSYNAQYER